MFILLNVWRAPIILPVGYIMDPSRFREFLKSAESEDEQEFLASGAAGGGTADFLSWALGLRGDERGRRAYSEWLANYRNHQRGLSVSRWWGPFCTEAFNLWHIMSMRYAP